jgi:hypothetical protein
VLTGFLIALPVYHLIFRVVIRKKLQEIAEVKKQYENEFVEMINRMNHHGVIPEGATSIGLLNIISLALGKCITQLEKLLKNKDWNTAATISDLQMIVTGELSYLHKKLSEFIESRRNILKDYHR